MGGTPEEIAAQELEQAKFEKAYEGKPFMRWFELVLMLNAFKHKPDSVIEDGSMYFVFGDLRKVLDEEGNTFISKADELPANTAKSVVVGFLEAETKLRLNADKVAAAERKALAAQREAEAEKRARKIAERKAEELASINRSKAREIEDLKDQLLRKAARTAIPTPVAVTGVAVAGPCSVLLCESLRDCSLYEAVLDAITTNKDLIGQTRISENGEYKYVYGDNAATAYSRGAEEICNRIMNNIPVTAKSYKLLEDKLTGIILHALKDSDHLGFFSENFNSATAARQTSKAAENLSRKIAQRILISAVLA